MLPEGSGVWAAPHCPLDGAQAAGLIMILETSPASAMREPRARNE